MMFNERSSAFSPWPNISNLALSTWPTPTNRPNNLHNSWTYKVKEDSSTRITSSSEPSPTLDVKNTFRFESAPLSPSWNMDNLDQLAAKLLKISDNEPLETIIPTSTPRMSPITAEGEMPMQGSSNSSKSRSSPDLYSEPDEPSGESSDPDAPVGSNSRFKTEICRNFKEKGQCLYGDLCQFAHGSEEMRNVGQHNKYKTKRCQKYWIAGYCAYGPRCNFLHNEERDQIQNKPNQVVAQPPQNMFCLKRSSFLRKGSSGDYSGESSPTTLSCSPPNVKFKLPITPVPLETLFRPTFGSGRLAAYTQNDEFFWIDIRTQKYV